MAKKRQSTGLPKQRAVQQPETEATNAPAPGGKARTTTPPVREQKSRREQEQETLRVILFWSTVLLAAIAILIGVVFVVDQVINPRRNVASVNGQGISVADFQKRVRIERALINEQISTAASPLLNFGLVVDPNDAINQLYQFDPAFRQLVDDLGASDRLGLRVLNSMIDDRLILQEANRLGLTVTDEEIDREIERFLEIGEFDSFDPFIVGEEDDDEDSAQATDEPTLTPTPLVSPTPSPEPTQTPESDTTATPTTTPFPSATPTDVPSSAERQQQINDVVAGFYRNVGRDAGVSRGDIREIFRVRVLRNKLAREVLDVPEVAIWVNARHILVSEEGEARDIIDAINAGESFAAIARISSEDTGSGSNGGELGWANTFNYVEGFREAVRDQEIGVVSAEPVQSDFGFHIIQVRDREERDIEDNEVDSILLEGFADWLREYRNSEENTVSTSNFWPDVVPQEPGFNFRQR
ncbi:MAG: hypothetical protein GFH27_549367n16 [Chloroflexi bacterium AL-W]|nr:hypothetical protein [Chloroflexi bacterium AL-W]